MRSSAIYTCAANTGANRKSASLPALLDLEAPLQVVEGEQRRGQKIMIFCNTLDSCRAADKYLQEHELPSLSYHGDVPLDGRRQAIASFAEGGERDSGGGSYAGGRQSSSQPVLVCTDLAARCAATPCLSSSLVCVWKHGAVVGGVQPGCMLWRMQHVSSYPENVLLELRQSRGKLCTAGMYAWKTWLVQLVITQELWSQIVQTVDCFGVCMICLV